jgi:ATP-dependent protease ClpP protease subunit
MAAWWVTSAVLGVQAAGNKGKRFAMKNTRIMMTQPMGESARL